MFNDRDLAVIGLGAVGSVACLLLPFSFTGKVAAGAFILILAMFTAFARFGYDRLTMEEWLLRRIRYHFRPKRWTYHQGALPGQDQPAQAVAAAEEQEKETAPAPLFSMRLDLITIERIASVMMTVAGIYFLTWLGQGGAGAIRVDLRVLLP